MDDVVRLNTVKVIDYDLLMRLDPRRCIALEHQPLDLGLPGVLEDEDQERDAHHGRHDQAPVESGRSALRRSLLVAHVMLLALRRRPRA